MLFTLEIYYFILERIEIKKLVKQDDHKYERRSVFEGIYYY